MAAAAPAHRDQPASLDAIVVGAGFGGLYQLHRLRDDLGLSAIVLEAGDGVGGTWYWNRYPGARCDSESHVYCYTFSEDLHRDWTWSERYPDHAEVRRYLNYVADRLDLKRDIRFGTRVTAARWDETSAEWVVETAQGQTFRARYLITAVGCLSAANVPDIPGRDSFRGRWLHTGQWPHDGVDFRGLKVGLVGTGSTGIQCTPVIAEEAAHLTVFQRTANYSVPARNGPLSEDFRAYVRDNRAEIRRISHSTPNGHAFVIADRSVFDVSDAERREIFETAWTRGGLQIRATFRDLLASKAANDTLSTFLKEKIRQIVKDPKTAEVLADIDHPFAAKRPPIDTGYFEAFNRDNVSLVDLRSEPIERITEDGIQTSAGTYPLDVIVFATGFDAMTGALLKMNIHGRSGRALADAWRNGPVTYLGLQVPGFPNLFTITGPGSPSVLCNMPVPIEQHVDWISDCLRALKNAGQTTIEASDPAAEGWRSEVERAAKATLLYDVKHSWYLGANVPGKPRVFMPYPGGMARYRAICDEVAAKGYEGFVRSAERASGPD